MRVSLLGVVAWRGCLVVRQGLDPAKLRSLSLLFTQGIGVEFIYLPCALYLFFGNATFFLSPQRKFPF